MAFQSYYMDPDGELRRDLEKDEIKKAFEAKGGLLWLNVFEPTEEDGRFMTHDLGLHPLSVADCVDPSLHNVKIEEYDEYLFLILRGIDYTIDADILQTNELDLFLGPHFVLTAHNTFLYTVDSIRRLVEQDGSPMRWGAVYLAHALVDTLVSNMMPAIERLGDRADDIEEGILDMPDQSAVEAITTLKRSCLRLRRAISAQREVLNHLSRHESHLLSLEDQRHFRDVYRDITRIEGVNEGLRERMDTALTIYLSVVTNRQNDAMRILATVAVIFLPLSLLAGIYGMNFVNMPELEWTWGYFAVVGFMVVSILVTLWWFWARRWITIGRRRLDRFVPTAVAPNKLAAQIGHAVKLYRR